MDELRLREGEVIKLKRGQRMVPMISVDIPVEIVDSTTEDTKQKTYMLKYMCPQGCLNAGGKPLTVRLTSVNADPGVMCGRCATLMVSVGGDHEASTS